MSPSGRKINSRRAVADTQLTKEQAELIGADVHRSRYYRHTMQGFTIEQIAKQDGVRPNTVSMSIDLVSTHRRMCTVAELEMSEIDLALSLSREKKVALKQMLVAVKEDNTPDHDARAKALEILSDILEAVRPKAKGGLNLQVGIQNNQPQGGAPATEGQASTTSVSYDFEGILRRIKQQREAASQLPAHEDVAEGQVIDAADTTQG